MYLEVSCHDKLATDEIVRKVSFASVEKLLNGVSVHTYYLKTVKEFLIKDMILSSPVDFPYGVSETSVRSHGTLAAIRRGANTIDLVGNSNMLANEKVGKFYDDIDTIKAICVENNVTLRVMLEYRLFEPEKVVRIANGIREIGIEYVLPSTSTGVDPWDDNLAMSALITEKASIKVITSGNIWKATHLESIRASNVFGARFSSLESLINILG